MGNLILDFVDSVILQKRHQIVNTTIVNRQSEITMAQTSNPTCAPPHSSLTPMVLRVG